MLQNKNFFLLGDKYKIILCNHEYPVHVTILSNPVVVFPAAPPLPAPAPIIPPPAPPTPIFGNNLCDKDYADGADISLPTDTDFDFTTASDQKRHFQNND